MVGAHRFAASTAFALVAVLALGCSGSNSNKSSTTASTEAPAPKVVTVTLNDFSFDAPDTLTAGYTTFQAVNKGTQLHHATLIRIDSGKTMMDIMEALKKQGPPPAWVVMQGGPQQNSNVTIDMTPGNYMWMCFIPGPDGVPHVMKGMMKMFTVTPAPEGTVAAAAPTSDIDVVSADYKWTWSQQPTAGTHTLKISTAPGQPHEFVLIRLQDGKTVADVQAFLKSMQGQPPIETVEGISTLQTGGVNFEKVDFKPGKYVVMCFVPDAKDGKEHAAHGMVQELVIQ